MKTTTTRPKGSPAAACSALFVPLMALIATVSVLK
jgi:hypothetical protein